VNKHGHYVKQVSLTQDIQQRLQAAAGADVVLSNLAIFEATALNTLPIRKQHPMYKDAVHQKSYLDQMAAFLAQESLPLQIMHDSSTLPAGRVFSGNVINGPSGPELRVLFWVDKTNSDLTQKIDNGTVDQVSVSALPKAVKCNLCGFDFLGPEATLDQFWCATCANDHVMGKDGAHAVMSDLASWYEMSLVNRGGAVGARIHGPKDSHFVQKFSGDAPTFAVLTLSEKDLSQEKARMELDLNKFVTDLADARGKLLVEADKVKTLEASVADLTAKLAAAAPKADELAATKAAQAKSVASLHDLASKLCALTGDATTKVAELDDAAFAAKMVEQLDKLKTTLSSKSAPANQEVKETSALPPSAFKRAR
jgi:hypothetical protein